MEETLLNALIVFWVIGYSIQELRKRSSKPEEKNPDSSEPYKTTSINNKPAVPMSGAKIIDDCLKGNVTNHPKLGNQRIRTSTIQGMTFDEDGTTLVETRNTVYLIELKKWDIIPDNHPSLKSDDNWWKE